MNIKVSKYEYAVMVKIIRECLSREFYSEDRKHHLTKTLEQHEKELLSSVLLKLIEQT